MTLLLVAMPTWAENYLVLPRSDTGNNTGLLTKSASENLQRAGMASDQIKEHYQYLGAVKVDLGTSELEELRGNRPDLLFIRSDIMLYHSEVMNKIAVNTPWHVLKAQPLQEYADETGAQFDSVLIFVLDTGVDTDHPDLSGNLEMNYARHFYQSFTGDSVLSDDIVSDYQGHGSEVTGTITGNSTGVAPSLKVVPIRSATNTGGLSLDCLTAACNYIMELKENELSHINTIINLSYNSDVFLSPDMELQSFFDALFIALKNREILFIGSAGNESIDSDLKYVYPTKNESNNYVAAASVRSNGVLSGFSNFGDLSVEVAAPGSSIYTTDKNGSYITVDGTSFASPFTAGIAGLIWAIDPSLEYWEVRNLLINAVSGIQVSTSFMSEYRGTENEHIIDPASELLSSTYENESVEIMAGKAISPAIIADMTYGPDPENGEEHVPFDAILSWDSTMEPVSFDLWFGESIDSQGIILEGQSASSTGLSDVEDQIDQKLSYDTNYFWRVDLHSGETSTVGTTWRFKTVTLKAYDNSPVNGASSQKTDFALSWSYDLVESTFDVYFSSDEDAVRNMNGSALIVSGTPSSSVNVTGLEYETTYYWRVVTHYSDPERGLDPSAVPGDILYFTTKTEDNNPDLVMSGGGGGGCSAEGYIPGIILLFLPLFLCGKKHKS